MPNWGEVLQEIQGSKRKDSLDFTRRKYVKALAEKRERNVIAYYSGWLQNQDLARCHINDDDKNGLMAVVNGLTRGKGVDLLMVLLKSLKMPYGKRRKIPVLFPCGRPLLVSIIQLSLGSAAMQFSLQKKL